MVALLLLLVGVGIGIALAVTGGAAAYLFSRSRSELSVSRKNLRVAQEALRKIANPATGRPDLEADLALSAIEDNYQKGR